MSRLAERLRWLGLALVLFVMRPETDRVKVEAQAWNLFHYTLGPRLFPEAGYWDLYATVLDADRVGDDVFRGVRRVRDLHTYEVVERRHLPPAPLGQARQDEVNRWLRVLGPRLSDKTWSELFRDRGYNGSPTLTVVLQAVLWVVPPESPSALVVLGLVDLAFLLVAAAGFGVGFGARSAAWWTVLFLSFPGVWFRQFGGLFEYDWLAALVLASASARRGWTGTAGVLLGWAAVTRVFPGVAAAAVLLATLRRPRPADVRLWVAFGATVGAGVVLGSLAGRGVSAWGEFAERIAVHAANHPIGEQRVGLAHLFTAHPALLESTEELRSQALAARAPARWLASGALAGLAIVTAVRRPREEALFHGLAVVFALSVTSRYYAAAFLAWPLVARRQTWMVSAFLVLPLVAVGLRDYGRYPTWLGVEAALCAILVVRFVEVLVSDLRVWRRWRRRRHLPATNIRSTSPPIVRANRDNGTSAIDSG